MADVTPLGELLAALGMSGDRFARRLNTTAEALGRHERVHPKTPYKWIRGEQPRSPWRSLTTIVLGHELGRARLVPRRPGVRPRHHWPPDRMDTHRDLARGADGRGRWLHGSS
jgi:hypothetical protein